MLLHDQPGIHRNDGFRGWWPVRANWNNSEKIVAMVLKSYSKKAGQIPKTAYGALWHAPSPILFGAEIGGRFKLERAISATSDWHRDDDPSYSLKTSRSDACWMVSCLNAEERIFLRHFVSGFCSADNTAQGN